MTIGGTEMAVPAHPLSPMSSQYRSGGVVFRQAVLSDDAELKATLRNNYMDSWLRMSLEREPSFFVGECLMGESVAVIAHEENPPFSTVGLYTCAFLPVHVNGKPERVSYLGGLRVNRPYRHKVRILKAGFASIQRLVPNHGTVPFWFTSVAAENSTARRLLEAGLKGMPVYRFVGEMETLAFAAQRDKRQGLLQQAGAEDVPALAALFNQQARVYQFAPVLTEEWLMGLSGKQGLRLNDFWLVKDGKDVCGCLAVWDQRAYKQIKVRGYRVPLNAWRGAYNCWAGLTRRVKLPSSGEQLEQAFLSFMAFDARAHGVALDAVREGLARVHEKGAQVGVCGLSPDNALCRTLKAALQPITYRTCIETVTWPKDPAPHLDERPPQPEASIL